MMLEQHKPLLQTKVFVPSPRARRVARPQLISKINEGIINGDVFTGNIQKPLTLVSTPAGFGKTTLLAEWTNGCVMPVAWISLDAEDNDPHRFLSYVVMALQRALSGIELEAHLMLHSPQPIPPKAILAALINELSELAEPFAMVFDDYQFIESKEVNEIVAYLLDHHPPQMHLVISTRSDPPLPLARLRGRNQLIEIRTDDLRFTPQETTEFLKQVMGLDLRAEELTALEERTEGWIVGLQMAALSLQGRLDASEFIRSFSGSHRYILEYLVEEVLNRQREDVRTFLLHTSTLDRLNGSLCDAVVGQAYQSQKTLEELEKANLFLVALDDENNWYRYHHLFADLLKTRLKEADPDLTPVLHLRASKWFEEAGWEIEAINHALAAQDTERAAKLIEQSAGIILTRGELTILLSRLEVLPGRIVRERPILSIMYAEALTFSGQLEAVERHLQNAEQSLEGDTTGSNAREVLGTIACIRAIIADMQGDITTAMEYARRADEILPKVSRLMSRSLVSFILSDGYFASSDLERAQAASAEIMGIGRATNNPWTIAVAATKLANINKIQGRLRAAEQVYDNAINLAEELGGRNYGTIGGLNAGYADLLRERNELESAQKLALKAIEAMKLWINPTDQLNGYTIVGRVFLAQGELDRAKDAFTKTEEYVNQPGVFEASRRIYEVQRVRLWLASGELGAAIRWTKQILSGEREHPDLPPIDQPGLPSELEKILAARVLITQGNIDEALTILGRLARATEAGGRNGRLIEILLLQAMALQAQRKDKQALKVLEKCMSLAEREGYVRVFVDEGQAMKSLIEAFVSQIKSRGSADLLGAYADKLLRAFPAPPDIPRAIPSDPQASLIEPLSARELEVLKLICEGCSNQEISDRLVISINTVKRHNSSIFSKLDVNNRALAIVRAHELGLAR